MHTETNNEQNGIDKISSLDESRVLEFLKGNPGFFNDNSDILPNLQIPHETGGAISLIEKQLSVFRHRCTALEDKLGELISVARENEQLHKRLHELVQDVISADSLDSVLKLTQETLVSNFRADDARIFLIDEKPGERHAEDPERFLAYDEPALSLFEKSFACGETICCVPSDEQREFLFDEETKVGSVAIIPLKHGRDLGMIVLTSVDARRFGSNKGVMFLTELGGVLSRRIATLM